MISTVVMLLDVHTLEKVYGYLVHTYMHRKELIISSVFKKIELLVCLKV